jgi:hypothetical protein
MFGCCLRNDKDSEETEPLNKKNNQRNPSPTLDDDLDFQPIPEKPREKKQTVFRTVDDDSYLEHETPKPANDTYDVEIKQSSKTKKRPQKMNFREDEELGSTQRGLKDSPPH